MASEAPPAIAAAADAATTDATAEAAPAAAANKRSPSDFLKSVLGRPVRVKLNSGIEYRGTETPKCGVE
mgnify:CR=1 FL=1